ncbi:MAG: LacI family transcriptional regulator, partial [Rhizobiales bacterium]|nr:LacI family transcriptional regulator [Hyphomicrobiales bacterium]
MLRATLFAGLATLALLVPAAAADFTLSPAIKARAEAKEKPTFVVSYHDPALSFAVPMRTGAEASGKEL